jgi:ELWxxDGT repeat protein
VIVGDMLFFDANDGIGNFELWKSDGTQTGTVLVKDINPSTGSFPFFATNVNGTLFFTAIDGTHGRELWKSDGTDAGTVLVRQIGSPFFLTNLNGILFFSGDEGPHDRELYAMVVGLPGFSNISTRGQVGTGDDVMIAGFIIEGGPKRVLIRALGPTLDGFGVPNTLDDPFLQIFSGATEIASNDDWKDMQQTEIEATDFAPGDDAEPGIVIELDEGPFTAIVTGVGGTTGNAIVEVFELE